MLFNSMHYMFFFPIVTLLYFIFPPRHRWLWLLVCSYYFYMSWNASYAGLILTSTFITYLSGILLQRASDKNSGSAAKKLIVAVSFITNLGILFFFKYFNFSNDVVRYVLGRFSLDWPVADSNYLLPVGISFYTFQALGYTMDVYRGTVPAEKKFGKYAVFVSFFPQLVAGPIERTGNLLPQFDKEKKFDSDALTDGLIIMGIGFFKKMVVADRLAVFVNTVYNDPTSYQGVHLLIATLFFSVQIYCDFSGYSDIAIGSAKILGFDLMTNFSKPYFSKSIAEFWRRWHISLSTWFKDYLYIPLGGNRVSRIRKHFNIMVVFLVSGLWHGANITFVVWGFLHGVFQIIGAETKSVKNKIYSALNIKTSVFSFKLGQVLVTFLLTAFAWIFFRANTMSDAFYIIKRMFVINYWELFDGSLYRMGLDKLEFMVAVISCGLLFLIDWLSRNRDIVCEIKNQNILFRYLLYLAAIFGILIFGSYGSGYNAADFIYFQF